MISNIKLKKFIQDLYSFYEKHGRHDLPWRKNITPYRVLVSEVMLQQTQVDRVIPKFNAWMKQFPTVRALARAPLRDVLLAWQGLGYNNRAIRLKRLAEIAVQDYGGKIPKEKEVLIALPGIGPYTAGAIRVFTWNLPEVFIETNIRRVFIHQFFHDQKNIHDKEIIPLLEKAIILIDSPRIWYWALMDYGSYLAKKVPNPNRKSKHYTKQSKFQGSVRQLRGAILRLVSGRPQTIDDIVVHTKRKKQEVRDVLLKMTDEGFLELYRKKFRIKKDPNSVQVV